MHVMHEETAAFDARAEAHLTGTLAVCACSCLPVTALNPHIGYEKAAKISLTAVTKISRSVKPFSSSASSLPSGLIHGARREEMSHPLGGDR